MKLPWRRGWPHIARQIICLPVLFLAGCVPASYRLFHPDGPIANLELQSTIVDVAIMLLIVLPVAVLLCVFMWRYRKSANAAYAPDWSHSLTLEVLVWGVPFVTVCALAFFSYRSTLEVNPYGPTLLGGAAAGASAPRMAMAQPAMPGMVMPDPAVSAAGPLQIDVITTDWQWFFIYPQYHIATIDDLVLPQGTDVQLNMTSATVVNDFFVPELAPMMDVMPGMRTVDIFRGKNLGTYEGFSADFSGAGFAWMQFATHVVAQNDFASWVSSVQAAPKHLSYADFQTLAKTTINIGAKPSYFSSADAGLFAHVYDDVRQGKVYPVPDNLTETMSATTADQQSSTKASF
jgi:cytochrome o ubiquinol oxidase subunit II